MNRGVRVASLWLALVMIPALVRAQAPVDYRLSFSAPEHRLMQVDITFPDLPPGSFVIHMSRSSPGRYALHEFAKNVFDVRITDPSGTPLPVTRPNLHQWLVTQHPGQVRVTYRIFGDRVDGTYLAVDSTHAHINMPAALMWAPSLDQRSATVRFDPPSGVKWEVATQLFPGTDPYTFSAPNLQYLMDSPAEFSALSTRTFTIADGARTPMFRIAVHHTGSDADLDAFAKDVATIVREARGVYGEFPAYEGNGYTFLADYLPWANGDGMEHRNSTILTSRSSIRNSRLDLLDGISHEFFHSWNVERIRPRSLEPFNLDDVNVSGELWLAEGFTNYYGPLILHRAGLLPLNDYVRGVADTINTVVASPGSRIRSAEDMSQLAPFVDAAVSIDRTNLNNVYLSYYTWGEAIGLGLDLTLRVRSNGVVTLDHFMRALWQQYGKPGGTRPGYVDRPYTMGDVVATLGAVSGDAAFAEDFVARYVRGHEVVDYARLLGRAGLILRPQSPGRPFVGELRLEDDGGQVRITAPVPMGSPAYEAGLERDDVITGLVDVGKGSGVTVRSAAEFERAIGARHPGDAVQLTYLRRGKPATSAMRIIEDPRQELIPVENTAQPLSAAQKQFRDTWLKSAAGSAF